MTLVSCGVLITRVVILLFRGGSLVRVRRCVGASMVVCSRLGLIRSLRGALVRRGSGARKSVFGRTGEEPRRIVFLGTSGVISCLVTSGIGFGWRTG